MIGPTLKPQNVYDSKKKDIPTNEGENKTPFFVIICGSKDVLMN
jgi:hypothetical protein